MGILGSFSPEQQELTLAELADTVDISRPTTFRLLSSLVHYRFVEQDPETKRYRLGLRLFELGNLVASGLRLVEVAKPRLERLVNSTGETANLAVIDDGMAVYIAKIEGSFSMRIASNVGLRVPCHCTGLGKALLAYHPEQVEAFYSSEPFIKRARRTITSLAQLRQEIELIRARGFAVDDEEFEDGVRCIAAPVLDRSEAAVAAVSISGPIHRITDEVVLEWANTVMGVANDISMALGGSGIPSAGPGADMVENTTTKGAVSNAASRP